MPLSAYSTIRDDNALITPGDIITGKKEDQQIINSIRQLMADLAGFQAAGTFGSLTVTGAATVGTTLGVTGAATVGSLSTTNGKVAINVTSDSPSILLSLNRTSGVIGYSGLVFGSTGAYGFIDYDVSSGNGIRFSALGPLIFGQNTNAAYGSSTFTELMRIVPAGVNVKYTNDVANQGPILNLIRESTTPAATALLGEIDWQGRNSTAGLINYARIIGVITDATAGSEDAELYIRNIVNGALVTQILLTATGPRLTGTPTNDNAPAGIVGEFISSSVAAPGGALTSGNPLNVTSISLTAGDWDVFGNVGYTAAATTSITEISESLSTVSATRDVNVGKFAADASAAIVIGVSSTRKVMATLATRYSLAATTTIYLVAQAVFTVAGLNAHGQLHARRAR